LRNDNSVHALQALSMLGLLVISIASAGIEAVDIDSSPTLYLDTPTSVRVGESFIVSLKVAGVVNLWGWQAKLEWDTALIELVGTVEGDFLKAGGTTNFLGGEWSVGWLEFPPLPSGVSGSGTLMNAKFQCTGPGESSLSLSFTRLFTGFQSVPWNGWGDANGDGIIDVTDAIMVSFDFGSLIGDPHYDPACDFNSDGIIDHFDLFCVRLNFGKASPSPVDIPVESTHTATGGSISQKAEFPVTWRWVNGSEDVWYFAHVSYDSDNPLEDFSYAQPLDYISFNITSSASGYCNVTIPKAFMSGAFQVLLNDTLTPSILSWNRTHTSVYFTYGVGTHNVHIKGEIATKLRGLWSLSDVNGDGIVDIYDLFKVAKDYGWHEP